MIEENKQKYKYTDEELMDLMVQIRNIVSGVLTLLAEGYSKLSEVQVVGVQAVTLLGHSFNFFGSAIMKMEKFRDILTAIINGEHVENIIETLEG